MAAATAAVAAAALQLAQAPQRHKLTRLLIFSSSEQPNDINKVALNCGGRGTVARRGGTAVEGPWLGGAAAGLAVVRRP